MDKDNIDVRLLLNEFLARVYPEPVSRSFSFPDLPGKIKVALGMRRTGKTWVLFEQIQKLIKKGIPKERILYINFEDERLLPMQSQELSSLIDAYYDLYPEHLEQTCYFFFDEIQHVEGWSLLLRRLLDTGRIDLYISGSSAKLLSKEIASELRGRSYPMEVWPFSFSEYLSAQKSEAPTARLSPLQHKKLKQHLENYIRNGGFPETLYLNSEERLIILQEYVNTVIYRDIVERHGITNLSLLKYLVKVLINMVAKRFSANKFFNDVKSQGLPVGKNTVHDYLGMIEDAYLSFSVNIFTPSIRKQNVNPRKIFLIDTGLAIANSLSNGAEKGHLFENLIYLDLRRARYQINYFLTKEGFEIDFAARSLSGQLHLFQVCYDTSDPQTKVRELRALTAATKELKAQGFLVTPQNYFYFLEFLKTGKSKLLKMS